MREFSSLTLLEVLSELKRPANTLITCHVKPDGDAIGSAFALKELLTALGSRVWVVCAEECPHRLAFLLDEEQSSILPESIPEDFSADRVIAVDTASPGQAGALFDRFGDCYTLSIDHHGRGTPFCDHWILPDAAATGEMIFTLAKALVKEGTLAQIPLGAAERMYAAMSSDTGSFKYSNATPATYRAASDLIELGVDHAEMNRKLYSSVPYLQLAAQYEGFSRLRRFCDGRIAVIPFPYEAKVKLGIRDEHTETLVDMARIIEGVEIAFVLKQPTEAPLFRLSMRSSIDFDVSAVCAVFGGGGHVRAAGATITDAADMEEAVARVLAEINRRLPS